MKEQPKTKQELLKRMRDDIIDIPTELEFQETELINANYNIDTIKKEKQELEIMWRKEIAEDTIKVGDKTKPKFSNETLREAEFKKRSGINLGYNELCEKERKLSQAANVVKVQIEYLKTKFKAIGYLIEIIKLERGI